MKIAGLAQLPFAPERAYELMQDPAILSQAVPGCESLERTGDGEYRMKMKMVLASFCGEFEGKVRLLDPVPPTSFRMVVEGSGKIGFMKGDGGLRLTPKDGGTEITYEGDVLVGGTLAAVGQRLIDTTARMMIKRFFAKMATQPSSITYPSGSVT